MNRMNRFVLPVLWIIVCPAFAVAATNKPHLSSAAMEERLTAVTRDARATEAAIKSAKDVTFFCANCHGEGGNSNLPDVPNLAGQNPSYLLNQMSKFADGSRRNEFMQGLIKAMSDEERINASVYYANVRVVPAPAANKVVVNKGKDLFFRVCQRCHGEAARGSNKIARLAGQKPEYVVKSLKRYRDGTGERLDPLMAANTKNLADAEISALATFISIME